ncbi:MAG: site-specific DNA-methyltransferase [candidate division WS1 bacterium]|jgi:DNA modification methylase|nr:site-specific DNA-methyltransferase [candidate division WS1 bacterium]
MTAQEDRLPLFPDDDDAPADEAKQERQRKNPRNTLNDLSGTEWIKSTKSWLICDSRRYHANRDTELHPARYPEELVAEFIRFFSQRGEWVLDPFCGSGATLVAAAEEQRNALGIEITPHYAEMTRGRLAAMDASLRTRAEVVRGDARDVADRALWDDVADLPRGEAGLPQFDFIMTSPPYWDMLRKSRGGVHSTHKQRAEEGLHTDYGDVEGNLGRVEDYDAFIEELGGIFASCGSLLRNRRYMVVVVQNVRVPEGYVRPLAWDLARRVSEAPGLTFQGERIWCQDSKKLGIWGYPTTFVPNYHHHYCLIFRRED